jgi:hypothetical protein
VRDGQDIFVFKDGKKVVRVDTSTRRVGYEEGAIRAIRWGKRVHVEVTFTLVVWPRGWVCWLGTGIVRNGMGCGATAHLERP